MPDTFFKIKFTSNLIYIGERIKKGTFKPSISPIATKYKGKTRTEGILPIPCSTAIGAIRSLVGEKNGIYAIGKIMRYEKGYMTVSPYDTALNTSKLPITIEYLANVEGEIFIKKNESFNSLDLIKNEIYLGGLKSKGFGRCEIVSVNEFEPKKIMGEGIFVSRIYYEEEILKQFAITRENILKPYVGYLFKKTSEFDGYYQKSLFENSIIKDGYNFLVEVTK